MVSTGGGFGPRPMSTATSRADEPQYRRNMETDMNLLTPTTAATLARRYGAFIRAFDGVIFGTVDDSVADAARDLKEIQKATGVVVMREAIIDLYVHQAAETARKREIELLEEVERENEAYWNSLPTPDQMARAEGFTFHD